MNNADVIKEFLVALGFRIDERSFKKFDDALGVSTKGAVKMGLAVTGTAAAVEVFVSKVATLMDRLYFMSKRTGASVEEIQSFSFAVSQMGGTADDAKASLENLARFMRTQPGSGGLLTRVLGVAPEHLKDASKVMNDLAATFQKMPFYLASRYAGMLGIDEKTLLAMRETGTLTGKENDYSRMAKERGIDLDALAKNSMEFNNQLKTLDGSFGLLAASMEGHLLPLVSRLNSMLLGLTSATAPESSTGQAIGDWLLDARDAIFGNHDKAWWDKYRHRHDKEQPANAPIPPMLGGPIGIRNNNPGNLRSWGGMPTAGGFAMFPTAADGLTAMAKQLNLYGKRGIDTLARIIPTWAPASDGNNVAAYLKDMVKQTGFAANQHLDLSDPETLAKLMNGLTMHENGRNPYSAALVSSAARAGAGAGVNATVSQKTDIHVHGTDPQATASMVANEQGRVNQQMVRNLVGAVQ